MKVSDPSRRLGPTKAPKSAKPRKKPKDRRAGSFRDKLDWRWLCRCVAARGVEARDVDDVAQEILVRAARAGAPPPSVVGQTPLQHRRGLLRRITRCAVSDYFQQRTARSTVPRDEIGDLAGPAPNGEEALEEKQRREVLGAALADLARSAPRAHALVEAHDLHERPMGEVTARLSIPQGTAWQELSRGRSALRAFAQRNETTGARRPERREERTATRWTTSRRSSS